MMSALKITALKMALLGLCQAHDVQRRNHGEVAMSIAGMMAKYFRHVVWRC